MARQAACWLACALALGHAARAQLAQGSTAAAAASLLPQNQQILARDMAPPAPPGQGGMNQPGADYSKICKPGDASCYDHTTNIGVGNLTVGRSFPPPARGPYNYAEALHKSYIFYDVQRSGKLPFQVGPPLGAWGHAWACSCPLAALELLHGSRAPWPLSRPTQLLSARHAVHAGSRCMPAPLFMGGSLGWDAHTPDKCAREQRLAWRSDSCLDCKGPQGEDLSGGFYEAGGSYLKFSFPTAYTLTQLAWGLIEFKDGYAKVRQGPSNRACIRAGERPADRAWRLRCLARPPAGRRAGSGARDAQVGRGLPGELPLGPLPVCGHVGRLRGARSCRCRS